MRRKKMISLLKLRWLIFLWGVLVVAPGRRTNGDH
jgi:hypothetical protein